MFEREMTDALFLKRWSIVRTNTPQSVAEHSWLVTMYVNDICTYLDLPKVFHLAALQYALWHDSRDEIFSGDMPGPNKRGLLEAIGSDAKKRWDNKLTQWAAKVFSKVYERSGGHDAHVNGSSKLIKSIVKCADWLEAATWMATCDQMGNRCATRHIQPNMKGALEEARNVVMLRYGASSLLIDSDRYFVYNTLCGFINNAVDQAQNGQSRGPWITGEDDRRTSA